MCFFDLKWRHPVCHQQSSVPSRVWIVNPASATRRKCGSDTLPLYLMWLYAIDARMTHFNEEIARLFFEIKGFLVRTNIPLPVGKGSPDSDIDLAVVNIRPAGGLPRKVLLDLEGVTHLRRAIVEVKGYHTERFSPSI